MSKNGNSKQESAVQKILASSGNGFHSKVVNFLRDEGWEVTPSQYYTDNFTEKPREIDILARKIYPANAYFGDHLGDIEVHLYVECKYIVSNTIFWFDTKNREKAVERIHKDSRLSGVHNSALSRHHYYAEDSVARLFQSDKSEEKDAISKAINQTLNAAIFLRDQANLFPAPRRQNIVRKLYYPIVVTNTFEYFHSVQMRTPEGEDSSPIRITKPFQFEIDYAFSIGGKSASEYFLIDFVNFDELSDFLKLIEKADVDVVNQQVSFEIAKQQREIDEYQRNSWKNDSY